jgi:small-conductance mechanosensitive channel
MDILRWTLLGNTLADWLLALGIALSVFVLLSIVKRITFHRVRAWVKRTRTDLDDLVVDLFGRTWYLLLVTISVYVGSLVLKRPGIEAGLRAVLAILLLAQIAVWGAGAIRYAASRRLQTQSEEDPNAPATINALSFVARLALWIVALILALDNIPGLEMDTLVAGLGITGIAVALSVQTVLRDLFAALAIHLDQPFVPGDFITVGEYWGTVLHTGIKSTRIRSITGERLIFSNTNLLDSRIRNYERMESRRVAFTLAVKLQTPYEKVASIRPLVKAIIESQPQTSYDRVDLQELTASALKFGVVYYVLTADHNVFLDIQHAVNMELLRRFAEEGIEFA